MDKLTPEHCATVEASEVIVLHVKDGAEVVDRIDTKSAELLYQNLHELDDPKFLIKVPMEVYFPQIQPLVSLTSKRSGVEFTLRIPTKENSTVTFSNKIYTYVGIADEITSDTQAYAMEYDWCSVKDKADCVSVCDMGGWERLNTEWDSDRHRSSVVKLYELYEADVDNQEAYPPDRVWFKGSEYKMYIPSQPIKPTGTNDAKAASIHRVTGP